MPQSQREGVLVTPQTRLSEEQISLIDGMSCELLEDPGVLSYNAETVELFQSAGAKTSMTCTPPPRRCTTTSTARSLPAGTGLPCDTTAGVGDASEPGIQATAEKMLAYATVPRTGAQYVHYAFGLLERTHVFCPEQAVLDDAHIGLVKQTLAGPQIGADGRARVLELVREVMASGQKTFMYHLPLPSRDAVYTRYPLEDAEGGALLAAHRRFAEIEAMPRKALSEEVRRDAAAQFAQLLPEATTVG